MKQPASQSKAYTSFILQRDKALEKLLVNAQRKINDELRSAFTRALEIITFRYGSIPKDSIKTNSAKYFVASIHSAVNAEFHKTAESIDGIYQDLLKRSYLLSSVGEAEAILRATRKQTAVQVGHHDLKMISEKTSQGEHIFDRIMYSLSKINSNLIHALELSRIRAETTEELQKRLLKALPPRRVVVKPRRALKPIMKESKIKAKGVEMETQAYISDQDWQEMVDDYMNDYIPSTRGPESVFDLETGEAELEEMYGWEIEKQLAHDFVNSVRSGQNEAANQNGIVDFSIISIIDDHTCEECCGKYGCVDFDGKTVTEVEEMTDGEQTTPPFHFNCRCTMAPMLDNMPELEQSNEEEFLQWLNS